MDPMHALGGCIEFGEESFRCGACCSLLKLRLKFLDAYPRISVVENKNCLPFRAETSYKCPSPQPCPGGHLFDRCPRHPCDVEASLKCIKIGVRCEAAAVLFRWTKVHEHSVWGSQRMSNRPNPIVHENIFRHSRCRTNTQKPRRTIRKN